ncbi:MAG: hypothetical protein GOV02_02825, partial [Candidatus Aenigmarchaeota archaeon]|nr:hypothetical protein [Candidatus Aenigmarchaeota archaeon]
ASKLIQRIGRSGHSLGKTSKGYIISYDEEDIFESAVVAKRTLHGELEPLRMHHKSLDVLAHQIMGFLIEDYEIEPKKLYEIVKKAHPYHDLTEDEFKRVVNTLDNIRLIYKDAGKIKRRRRAFEYYFENLSTIPDNKIYKVIDMTSNSFVGTLDENFVMAHGDVDSTFIVKGRPWRVVSVEDRKIMVEPSSSIESAVPSWEGEMIPVPFEVAQEVGKVRRLIAKHLETKDKKEVIVEMMKKYPIDKKTASEMIRIIKKQITNHPLPDDKTIVYEKFKDYTVINACFGSKINQTVARHIAALLSAEYGTFIQTDSSAYRIIFKDVNVADIKKIIKEFKKEDLESVLTKELSKSNVFKGRFLHVAKRFGVLSKYSQFTKINLDRLIDTYWKTPIFDETMNELFIEKLDMEGAVEIFEKMKSGKIKQIESDKLSPIGKLGFSNKLRDIAKPDRPEAEIFKIFKERLLGTKMRIICLNCGKYAISEYVKNITKDPRCPKCTSKLIGVTRK